MGRNAEAYTEDPTSIRAWLRASFGGPGRRCKCAGQSRGCPHRFPQSKRTSEWLERGAIELFERMFVGISASLEGGHHQVRALGVMAGYPEIDDEPAHGSRKWMTQVLRQELGFQGLVESEGDGFATLIDEGIVATRRKPGIGIARRSGLNITYEPAYMAPLIQNVDEGRVPVSLVDLSVRRVLREVSPRTFRASLCRPAAGAEDRTFAAASGSRSRCRPRRNRAAQK